VRVDRGRDLALHLCRLVTDPPLLAAPTDPATATRSTL
jgi:hypothetical protein